jgi:hypothetical protein
MNFLLTKKGKPTQTPTARWVFQTFIDIHLLSIGTTQQIIMNLKDYHQVLLGTLGEKYLINYLLL